MSIEKFANEIYAYGYAMRLTAIQGSTPSLIVAKTTPIHEIIGAQSLIEYFRSVINDLKPQKIIAEVGKRNGTAFVNKKDFVYEIQPSDIVSKKEAEITPDPIEHLGMVPVTNGNNGQNPLIQMYTIQLQQANHNLLRKSQQFDTLETKYENLKDSHAELKQKFDTQEQRFALEREKDRVAGENTASSVAREFRPEINSLLGMLGEKIGGKKGISGPAETKTEENTISNVILATLLQMGEPQRLFAFELLVRGFNLTAEDAIAIMEQLREKTPSLTAGIASELETLINK